MNNATDQGATAQEIAVSVDPHDVTFEDAFGPLDYLNDVDLSGAVKAAGRGGTDDGVIVVRLGVDGERAQVLTDLHLTGDLAALEAAVEALQRAHAHLVATFEGRLRAGTCLAHGGWGRCERDHGHSGDHTFPDGVA